MIIGKNFPYESTRFVYKFLFFPKTLNGEKRWLSIEKIKQKYVGWAVDERDHWKDYDWADKVEVPLMD